MSPSPADLPETTLVLLLFFIFQTGQIRVQTMSPTLLTIHLELSLSTN